MAWRQAASEKFIEVRKIGERVEFIALDDADGEFLTVAVYGVKSAGCADGTEPEGEDGGH